jgi:hypothetical protein
MDEVFRFKDSVEAELVGGSGRSVRTYGRGRVCPHPGCGAVLSMYNSGKRCALHDWQDVPIDAPGTRSSTSRVAA